MYPIRSESQGKSRQEAEYRDKFKLLESLRPHLYLQVPKPFGDASSNIAILIRQLVNEVVRLVVQCLPEAVANKADYRKRFVATVCRFHVAVKLPIPVCAGVSRSTKLDMPLMRRLPFILELHLQTVVELFLRWLWGGPVSVYILASSLTLTLSGRRLDDFVCEISSLVELDLVSSNSLSSSDVCIVSSGPFSATAILYFVSYIALYFLRQLKVEIGTLKKLRSTAALNLSGLYTCQTTWHMSVYPFFNDVFSKLVQHHVLNQVIYDKSDTTLCIMGCPT